MLLYAGRKIKIIIIKILIIFFLFNFYKSKKIEGVTKYNGAYLKTNVFKKHNTSNQNKK